MQNTPKDLTKVVNMKHRIGNETRNHRKKNTKTLDGRVMVEKNTLNYHVMV